MARRHEEAKDRDQQILNRLAHIEHKVSSIDQTSAFALRADADKHAGTVGKIFNRGKRRAQVYLAANGSRGVQEIARYLGMKRQNVGRELRFLEDAGLLEIVGGSGPLDIWGKKSIDRTLRITQYLCNTYYLGRDGKPVSARNKKKKH